MPAAPPIETVPHPGVWRSEPADLFGGFILQMARMLDSRFPIAIFERIVRTVWNIVQRSSVQEFPIEVTRCGHVLHMAGIDFYRVADGHYANLDDPTRAPTGAAMYYDLRIPDRGTIVGEGFLMAPAPMLASAAKVTLNLRKAEDDHWLRLCGTEPECDNLDGSCE